MSVFWSSVFASKKIAPDSSTGRKTLFMTIVNRKERLYSTLWKQKAGKFLSTGVSKWKSNGGRYGDVG